MLQLYTHSLRKCYFIFFLFPLMDALQAQPVIKAESLPAAGKYNLQNRFTKSNIYRISSSSLISQSRQQGGGRLTVQLELPGLGNWPLVLTENKLVSKNYTAITAGPDGIKKEGAPLLKTYSGYITGDASGSVQLTIAENLIYGIVKKGRDVYYIEPLHYPGENSGTDQYVVYEEKSVLTGSPITCAASETAERRNNLARNNAGVNCVNVNLAIASDAGMIARYGSSAAVQVHNIGVMNNVNWNFVNGQFSDNIEFTIVAQYVSQAVSSDPLSPAYSGTDYAVLLNNFTNWGNAGGFGQIVDLGQFWTTRDLGANEGASGVVGFAWVGVLCTASKYHLLEDFTGSNPSGSSANLMAAASHEIGHNFNLAHDASTTNIMHPSITSSSVWSPASIAAMANYIPALTCLTACNAAGPPATDFICSSNMVCTGSGIQLTDHSLHGPTGWHWSFPGADISTSTDRNPFIIYSTAGLKTVTLTTSNSQGNGNTITKTILVGSPVPASCTPNGTSSSNAGVKGFVFGQIRKISGSAAADGNKYMDFSCSDITSLLPGSTYKVDYEVGDWGTSTFNGVSFFIDYNNDGDFSDAGENVFGSGGGASLGWGSFNFTTPSSLPVTGQILKARMIAKDWVWADDPCHDPVAGQVEDYGVFFPPPMVLPVRLLDFSGSGINNRIKLEWRTASEIAHSHFEIERSENGINFEKIGSVPGTNNTTFRQQYHFTDNGAGFMPDKKYFYRLKIVSTSGTGEYSRIIVINGNVTGNQELFVFPNPFREGFTFNITLNRSEKIQLQLVDAAGKLVYHTERTGVTGQNSMNCAVPAGLPSGFYILKAVTAGQVFTQKISRE